MVEMKVPCEVCTTSIPANTHRYGGRSCNSCASFYSRSIEREQSFKCQGTNECLKEASLLGKGCRRCRFDKCIEIGMTTNAWIQHIAAVAALAQRTEQLAAQPAAAQAMEVEPAEQQQPVEQAMEEEPVHEPSTVFAASIDSVLTFALTYPHLVVSHLAETDSQFLTYGFTNFDNSNFNPLSGKITMLSFLLNKFPITLYEFPVLLQISLCKMAFKGFTDDAKVTMQIAQSYGLSRVPQRFNIPENRLIELADLAQHFLNIYYIFC